MLGGVLGGELGGEPNVEDELCRLCKVDLKQLFFFIFCEYRFFLFLSSDLLPMIYSQNSNALIPIKHQTIMKVSQHIRLTGKCPQSPTYQTDGQLSTKPNISD